MPILALGFYGIVVPVPYSTGEFYDCTLQAARAKDTPVQSTQSSVYRLGSDKTHHGDSRCWRQIQYA